MHRHPTCICKAGAGRCSCAPILVTNACLVALQDSIQRWDSLQLEQKRYVFDAALVAAGEGAWGQLEKRLQAALGPAGPG